MPEEKSLEATLENRHRQCRRDVMVVVGDDDGHFCEMMMLLITILLILISQLQIVFLCVLKEPL